MPGILFSIVLAMIGRAMSAFNLLQGSRSHNIMDSTCQSDVAIVIEVFMTARRCDFVATANARTSSGCLPLQHGLNDRKTLPKSV